MILSSDTKWLKNPTFCPFLATKNGKNGIFEAKYHVFSGIRYPTDTWTNIRLTDIFKYPGYPLSWISVLETLIRATHEDSYFFRGNLILDTLYVNVGK